MAVEKGNKVSVNYTGTLEDGSVFDSSKESDQTLDFEVGSGQLIKGFDEAIIGMSEGETKTVTLKPEEAYGERNEELIQAVPREAAKNIPDPKPGMVLGLQGPNGENLPATITEVTDEEISFDLNHPLAGKTLNFEITLEKINE
ncbi:MAG: FKBP-type peptidyl-prolyl cis-trans isomerase [Candidatus Woesearchaeota archaeon]